MTQTSHDTLKVLVVDDDPIALEVVVEALSRGNYDIHQRDRALGTSTWIIKERPDIVVVDVNMPGIGGDSIAALTKQRLGDDAPSFVLMSSMASEELSGLARSTGALGFLRKGEGRMLSRFDGLVDRHRRSKRV